MRRSLGRRLLAYAILLAVGCGRPSPSPPADREQADRLNNQGVARLERFEYGPAAELFRQALAVDGSLAAARLNLSLALLYAQDLQGAMREATEAARLLPSAPEPPYVLALVARAENRTADAIREFERVVAIDPDDPGTNVNLGQIYLEQRQYPAAVAVLRKAAAVEPYNVSAAYNLGLALTRDNQAEGPDVLARAQALRTTGYALTYGTGYLEQGRYAEALTSSGAEPDLVDAATPPATFSLRSTFGEASLASPAASPVGRVFRTADLAGEGARTIAAGLGGCLSLIDVDSDGDADIYVAGEGGERLYRNDGSSNWSDVSAAVGLAGTAPRQVAIGCVTGDYDNDGRDDLFVIRAGGTTLYRGEGGRLADVTRSAGLPAYPFLPGAAAMVDVDHDGDLDLAVAGLADVEATRRRAGADRVTFPADFVPAPLVLWRNNGNGRFTDATRSAGIQLLTHAVAIAPTDFDNHRDVDLLVVNRHGPPVLLQNQRDGTFKDVASQVGLVLGDAMRQDVAATALGDINHDDAPDLFFSGRDAALFALSDGRGRFRVVEAPAAARGALGAQFLDYDNDGLLDLVCWSASGLHVIRHVADLWTEASGAPGEATPSAWPTSARGLAAADVDGNGTVDLVTFGQTAAVWRNSALPGRRSQRVTLRGRASNRSGVGAKVQIRAGSLRARFETSAATPAVVARDVVFGLGGRDGAEAVRVLWPSGTLQAEIAVADPASANGSHPMALASPMLVEELDRKPSSCPFLYTWNGHRFEFITDFMGGGEMGYWEAPGIRNVPDPLEYVRIAGDRLQPKDGRYQLRVTNELEEAIFVDRLALRVIDHPRRLEVYPNEGMTLTPKADRLFAVTEARVPKASDDHGHDVTDQISRIDHRSPDDFLSERFRGYARPHELVLDLAAVPARPVLLLTAWTDYAFSSDNVAAHQAGLSLTPPRLEVRSPNGRWRVVIHDIGIPVGRPQTIPVDLTGLLRPGERQLRIATNMKIYWDQIRVATLTDDPLRETTLMVSEARLRERGFSAEVRGDGDHPFDYDYSAVSSISPWKTLPGRYTRPGDVGELLQTTNDMFVIAKPGDEIAIEFEAAPLGPPPDGWTRTFLLVADGFSKEMDINSASPDRVEPLPFHRMSGYPYSSSEHYPQTEAHRRYQDTYNTRVVTRPLPSIEAVH